jgi:hypothetical protein
LAGLKKVKRIRRGKAQTMKSGDFEESEDKEGKDKEGFLVPDSPLFTRVSKS